MGELESGLTMVREAASLIPPRQFGKRALDVAMALLVLAAGFPLWLLIGLAVRVTSPGPALFRAPVVGRGGKLFTYYKFRTMKLGDDTHHRDWLHDFVLHDRAYTHRGSQPVYKVIDDARVTRLGRLLRRLSLDEVPQLLNVLRGEMSIVGPRPPVLAEFDLYDERARQRLAVRPGLTGLCQVSGRSMLPFSQMLALDLEYVRRWSLKLDLSIMLRTLWVVLRGRGAV